MRAISSFIAAVALLAVAVGCGPKAPKDTAPSVDERNTNYRPGGGALINSLRAGKRAALMTEMNDLGLAINQVVILDDKMPSKAEIEEMLRKDYPKYAALVKDGTIVLTDTKDKRGLWAYEVDSDKAGGIALVGGSTSRITADEIKALLAK